MSRQKLQSAHDSLVWSPYQQALTISHFCKQIQNLFDDKALQSEHIILANLVKWIQPLIIDLKYLRKVK